MPIDAYSNYRNKRDAANLTETYQPLTETLADAMRPSALPFAGLERHDFPLPMLEVAQLYV